jgi:hypothetical protein
MVYCDIVRTPVQRHTVVVVYTRVHLSDRVECMLVDHSDTQVYQCNTMLLVLLHLVQVFAYMYYPMDMFVRQFDTAVFDVCLCVCVCVWMDTTARTYLLHKRGSDRRDTVD